MSVSRSTFLALGVIVGVGAANWMLKPAPVAVAAPAVDYAAIAPVDRAASPGPVVTVAAPVAPVPATLAPAPVAAPVAPAPKAAPVRKRKAAPVAVRTVYVVAAPVARCGCAL